MRTLFLAFLFSLAAAPLHAQGGGASSVPRHFTNGDVSYFAARNEVWRTDGTPEGTRLFATAGEGEYVVAPVVFGREVLFFSASGSGWRTNLYASDGVKTRKITSLESWAPSTATVFRDKVYFISEDYRDDAVELWATDGTAAGTRRMAVLAEGSDAYLVRAGSRLFITMTEWNDYRSSETLWSSDGTTEGTTRVAANLDYPRLTPFGELLLFENDGEIWRSDGSTAGTYELADGVLAASGATAWILELDNYTQRLLRSDGSLAGTERVWDFDDSVTLVGATENGKVFLVLWREGKNQLIALDVRTRTFIAVAELTNSYASTLRAVGDTLYFIVSTKDHGDELWRSGGTVAGTRLVRTIAEAVAYSAVEYGDVATSGARLVFSASDQEHGYEPWVTDGTAAGTHMLANIAPEARIEGRIVDAATGAGIAGATVALHYTSDDGSYSYSLPSVVSEADGRYVVRHLPNGRYRISVTSTTHLPHSSSELKLGSGATVSADLALQRGATITGRVVDAQGALVAGIPIEAGPAFGTATVRTQTDANGHYVAGGLPAGGPWLVWTAGDQYSQSIYAGVQCLAGCTAATRGTEINLATGELRTGVDFTVAPRGRIRGRVIDALTGAAEETYGTVVYGFRAGAPIDREHPAFRIPVIAGEFDAAVPDGVYHLLFTWSRTVRDVYDWTWYPNVSCTTCGEAAGLAVTPLQDPHAAGYTIMVMQDAGGYASGRVVDDAGTPVAGLFVRLTGDTGNYAGGARTREDGTFHALAPPGTYSVSIEGSTTHLGRADVARVSVHYRAVTTLPDVVVHGVPRAKVRAIDAVTQELIYSYEYTSPNPDEREITISYTGWKPATLNLAPASGDDVTLVVPLEPACNVTVEQPPVLPATGGTITLRVDAACTVCPQVRGFYQRDYIRCVPAGGGEMRLILDKNPDPADRPGMLILPGVAIPLTQEGFRAKTRAVR